MAYSIGVWRNRDTTVYRWESDYGGSGKLTGCVLLDAVRGTVRPCTVDGTPIGDLTYASGSDPTGSAEGVNAGLFQQIAASIVRKFLVEGEPPETAHKFYG